MFYQTLSLMGRKDQLHQNLTDCKRLLCNCMDMIQVMIKTVNQGEKSDEICKYKLFDATTYIKYFPKQSFHFFECP